MRIRRPEAALARGLRLSVGRRCRPAQTPTPAPAMPPVLVEVDRTIREGFFDPKLKGTDWTGAVERAARGARRAPHRRPSRDADLRPAARDALGLAHVPHAGRPAARARLGHGGIADRPGRRRLRRQGRAAGQLGRAGRAEDRRPHPRGRRTTVRQGTRQLPRSLLRVRGRSGHVRRRRPRSAARRRRRLERLARTAEESGDALVWKSARVIRKDGKAYGYAHIWGMSTETALAVVDMLLDRSETGARAARARGLGRHRGLPARRARQQRRLRSEHPLDVSAGAVERGRLLRDLARRKAPRASRVRPAARRAPRELRHGVGRRGARAEVPRAQDRPDRRRDDGRAWRAGEPPRRSSRTARRSGTRPARSRGSTERATKGRAWRRTSRSPIGRRRPRGRRTRSSRRRSRRLQPGSKQ